MDLEARNRSWRLEILEATLLAVVAVATAWSGYQSARWDGRSAESYAQAAALRMESDEESNLGGQRRLQDVSTFNAWIHARAQGDDKMTAFLERRFSAEYTTAFKAWLLTDPFENPDAPAGPAYMPEYVNSLKSKGAEFKTRAAEELEEGKHSREKAEDYVRITVLLATVLFLIAISQRFHVRIAKLGLLGLAVVATGVILWLLITFPRA